MKDAIEMTEKQTEILKRKIVLNGEIRDLELSLKKLAAAECGLKQQLLHREIEMAEISSGS